MNNKIKIVFDHFQEKFMVMEGGNPYHQIYSGTLKNCQIILDAYVKVGYENWSLSPVNY